MELPNRTGLALLPARFEIAIYVIRMELKNRRFTKGLEYLGFDPTFCAIDLSVMILELVGFESRSDEVFEMYNILLEKHVKRVNLEEDGGEELSSIATDFYYDLESQRERLN